MIKIFDFIRKFGTGTEYRKDIHAIIDRILDNGYYILGPEVKNFEEHFSKYIGAAYTIGVNSGTDAIFLGLRAVGVEAHDEVITVSHTATPTISAIRLIGAIPVFVDVDPKTHAMNPALLEAKITPKTKAILPVHMYGYPAPIKEIMAIAKKHKIPVVEDACQSHGAEIEGKKVGTFGEVGCFSFYPTKNLGALGDGGAVVTNDKDLADKVYSFRNYGEASKFNNVREGMNSRLDELQAAILSWGLLHLDEWNNRREELAKVYIRELQHLPITLPEDSEGDLKRVWHLFVIETDKRDELKNYLKEKGIDTMIHYPTPVFKQPAYAFLNYTDKDLPETLALSKKILSLPLYPELTEEEVVSVCKEVRAFYK
jgi:dTDP-4-amino-4,6-dideoxygalactose transaminase